MRKILFASIFIGILAITLHFAFRSNYLGFSSKLENFVASIFFIDSSTKETLLSAYGNGKQGREKIKILVVPGHDNAQSGAEFRGVSEADLTAELGEKLAELLRTNPFFDVYLSRTKAGYDPVIQNYLEREKGAIEEFVKSQKSLMQEFVALGKIKTRIVVEHNRAPSQTAQTLYGINKWTNDSGIDIAIHIHFNDHPREKRQNPGAYSGFSVYIPERQYSNAKGSKALSESIFARMSKFYPSSDLPKEDAGIVEDQELIAIGANNTVDGAALLVEYGYIYEPILQERALAERAISDFALQTYLGVMDFFGEATKEDANTRHIPYEWKSDMARGTKKPEDVASLQAALTLEGLYPPPGKSKNDCPISGIFGPCTEESIRAFQKKYGIVPASGALGPKTREKLGELYGD